MNVQFQSANYASDNQFDNNDASMHYRDASSLKASSTLSINVPSKGHVLPDCSCWFYTILSLLCVADKNNINSLLCSILYQRQVWSIIDLVVYIMFSKIGMIKQVLLGWLDLTSLDKCSLVHCCSCYNVYTYEIYNHLWTLPIPW